MTKKLSNIAELISGYSFRGAVPHDPNGSSRAVQVKDINESGEIELTRLFPINSSDIKTDAFLQKNDILLSIRGTEASGLKVGIYIDNDENTIATSSLYVLRVKEKSILPEYFLYYLKSFYGQLALKSMMSGATIQSILKRDLANLTIPIPPLKKQQTIIETMANITKQKKLLTKKINLLQILTDNIISIHA